MIKIGKYFWRLICLVAHRVIHDRIAYSASALTYTTLLALVPLLAVVIGILSAFPVFNAISSEVQKFIFSHFIPESGEIIRHYLQGFVAQTGKLSAIGTVFLIVTAIMMMLTVDSALNDIWQVKKTSYTFSAIIRYWAVLSLAPIFVSLSIAATSSLISLSFIAKTASTLKLAAALSGAIPYLLTITAFSLIYIIVPNYPVPIKAGVSGAIIATILFELAKKVFVIYLSHFPTYQLVYGAVAAIPIFLLWLYVSWVIILFGALISNILTNFSYVDDPEKLDGFSHAFLWLGFLWKAQQNGTGVTLAELCQMLQKEYQIDPNRLIQLLKQSQFIHQTDNQRLMLSRDLSQVTMAELYESLPWKLPNEKLLVSYSKKIESILVHANRSLKENLQIPLAKIYETYL